MANNEAAPMAGAEDHIDGRCEPAYSLVQRLGGYAAVAEMVRKHGPNKARAFGRASVYRWTRPETQGGTGGVVPYKHWRALRIAALRVGVDLCVYDLMPAADAAAFAREA